MLFLPFSVVAAAFFVLLSMKWPRFGLTLLFITFIIPLHYFAWMMFSSFFSNEFSLLVIFFCDIIGLFGAYLLNKI